MYMLQSHPDIALFFWLHICRLVKIRYIKTLLKFKLARIVKSWL